LKECTTPDSRNTPSTTDLEEEEIVDAPGKRWQCVDAGTEQTTYSMKEDGDDDDNNDYQQLHLKYL